MESIWIDYGYSVWVQTRLAAIIDFYGAFFFAGKRVIDLGAGHGGLGGGLLSLGATVTFVDGREVHVTALRNRYPKCTIIQMNLDTEWPTGEFDLAIFMGCIYHLDNPSRAIYNCANYPFMILETEVLDSLNQNIEMGIPGEGVGVDQAIGGVQGKHPTVSWIEREMASNGITATRFVGPRCNHGIHEYDWMPSGVGHKNGRRAMWFCRGIRG